MTKEKQKLLVVRDVISREIYELENKIMQSRLSKLKYKYLEERKDILSEFMETIDDELLFSQSSPSFDIIYEDEKKRPSTNIDIPTI